MCPGEDLNLHGIIHSPLKTARLPISPPGQKLSLLVHKILSYLRGNYKIYLSSPIWAQTFFVFHPVGVDGADDNVNWNG